MPGNNSPVILVGSGGHSHVLIECLRCLDCKIIGIVDPVAKRGSQIFGLNVLGDDSVVEEYANTEVRLINGLGALPNKPQRWIIADQFRQKGYKFLTVIHPNTIVSKDVEISEGVQIMAGSILQPGVSIGQDSIINTGSTIDHDVDIGKQCHIAPGVTIGGDVIIGSHTHVGSASCIMQGIHIGENCTIAMGSVIFKNVVDGERVIQRKTTI